MNIATINGLIDGISVVEKDNNFNCFSFSDILFNDKEPADLKSLYYEDFIQAKSEYRVEDFGEGITLTSTVTDSIINTDQVDEYGFKLNY